MGDLGLTGIAALEAEMRDRLKAKNDEIARLTKLCESETSSANKLLDHGLKLIDERDAAIADRDAALKQLDCANKALRGAMVVIECLPRPSEGLISNKLQAEFDRRVDAIRAAIAKTDDQGGK